jgi:hypothetical protein
MSLDKKLEPKNVWIYILIGTILLYIVFSIILNLFSEKSKTPQVHIKDKQNVQIQQERQDIKELYLTACVSAEKGETCFTKLPELGLISPENCCELFGKCCQR